MEVLIVFLKKFTKANGDTYEPGAIANWPCALAGELFDNGTACAYGDFRQELLSEGRVSKIIEQPSTAAATRPKKAKPEPRGSEGEALSEED